MANLYRVKYAVLDYTPKTEHEMYGEVKEEIVGELGLTQIQLQCDDGLTVILEVEVLQSKMLPDRIRTVEYVDEKGLVVGTETAPRLQPPTTTTATDTDKEK